LRVETGRIPGSGSAHGMDRQTRFQSDPIAAALLAGDVLVRGAAAFDLHASLPLAAPAAPAGDLDLRETQGACAPARPATVKSQSRKLKTGCFSAVRFRLDLRFTEESPGFATLCVFN